MKFYFVLKNEKLNFRYSTLKIGFNFNKINRKDKK